MSNPSTINGIIDGIRDAEAERRRIERAILTTRTSQRNAAEAKVRQQEIRIAELEDGMREIRRLVITKSSKTWPVDRKVDARAIMEIILDRW